MGAAGFTPLRGGHRRPHRLGWRGPGGQAVPLVGMLGPGNRPGCLFFSVWPPRLKQSTYTHHRPMTYEESFLDTCGRNGEASLEATRQLFRDHGNDYDEVVRNIDEYTSAPDEMLAVLNRDGRGLLSFLGY